MDQDGDALDVVGLGLGLVENISFEEESVLMNCWKWLGRERLTEGGANCVEKF